MSDCNEQPPSNNDNGRLPSVNAPDKPTKVAYLGWRFLYTLIAWAILAKGIVVGDSFFVSLFLFSIPLFMDYFKFKPDTYIRRIIRSIGIWSCGIWVVLSVISFAGILTVVTINNQLMVSVAKDYLADAGAKFPILDIWYCMAFNVLLTGADWVLHETEFEQWMKSRLRIKDPKALPQSISEGAE